LPKQQPKIIVEKARDDPSQNWDVFGGPGNSWEIEAFLGPTHSAMLSYTKNCQQFYTTQINNMNGTQSTAKNVLTSDVEVKGTLKFTGELVFDGKLEGDINSEGSLSLGDNAVVKGNINVTTVTVRGKITGNITAKEKIDIKTKTELFGDIRAPKLVIEEGVTFVGKSEINPNKVTPSAPPVTRNDNSDVTGRSGKAAVFQA
jgi:cytoskeletal protein CcmA (bactofilin family)